MASSVGRNALFLNQGGLRFAIAPAGALDLVGESSSGVVMVDVDGDGDLDLIVTTLRGANVLLLNDGTGTFTLDAESGLESGKASETATLADIDDDGDLDLYIANYQGESINALFAPDEVVFDSVVRPVGEGWEIAPRFRNHFRLETYPGIDMVGRSERGDPDRFYLNDGTGHFVAEPFTNGRFLDEHGMPITNEPDHLALAARFYDVDDDGDPDLYVANDFSGPDGFWLNDGDGTFRSASTLALRTTSHASMAVDFADVDRNGTTDFFTADMLEAALVNRKTQDPSYTALPKPIGVWTDRRQIQRNRLQMGRGDGTWRQTAEYSGVEASGWSWGTVFLDIDLDGYEDLFITTGHMWDQFNTDAQQRVRRMSSNRDWRERRLLYPPLSQPNVVFRNVGGGRFTEVSAAWGVEGADISHGVAVGDLDGDGDADVVVNRLGAPVAVYRNDATAPRVKVRLRGTAPNTHGIGARVTLTGGPVVQQKELTAGGLYLSSAAPEVSFAAGGPGPWTLTVRWRNGQVQTVPDVQPNREYEIAQGGSVPTVPTVPAVPLFTERADLVHTHHETAFNDFQRQPLLPNTLSQAGPGVSWLDLDQDGTPELVLPSGRGGRLAAFRVTGQTVQPYPLPAAATEPAAGDQTMALLADATTLLLATQSYEAPTAAAGRALAQVVAIDLTTGTRTVLHTGVAGSLGPVSLADIDGDTDLDLFVGGRVIPTAYPLAPASYLYRRTGAGWVRDSSNQALLDTLGMVSAAHFDDLDQDGDSDLALAIEWGPVRLLYNDGTGHFTEGTTAAGLAPYRSRWRGLTTGDFDTDGQLELVVTSWGDNTTRRPTPTAPWHLYFGDFDRSGSLDLLEAQLDVPLLESLTELHRVLPYTRTRLPTAAVYAAATIRDVVGPAFVPENYLAVTTLTHVRFVPQDDGTYTPVPLPPEAQWAPASAPVVADFTGDGHLDLVLSQNFFPTAIATPRYDAGRALLLTGDGTGRLTPMPGPTSGLITYGDQRGAAAADLDRDGRLDLALAQNGAPTRLWHNVAAPPGLRVTLQGPPANPHGIGAQLWLGAPDGRGPTTTLTAGTGYWSVMDAVAVLAHPTPPTQLTIRWPGGTIETRALSPGQRAITVTWAGR
ncbi:MAG: VCBS repeat-containing protein [Deltaproteobacteria bacterium]|nr:VCBS repeat-containing protein [Deltaproteobacteria bacterium]